MQHPLQPESAARPSPTRLKESSSIPERPGFKFLCFRFARRWINRPRGTSTNSLLSEPLARILVSIPALKGKIGEGGTFEGSISRPSGEYEFSGTQIGPQLLIRSFSPKGNWRGSGDSVAIELITAIVVNSRLMGIDKIIFNAEKSNSLTGYYTCATLGFEAYLHPDNFPTTPDLAQANNRMRHLAETESGKLSLLQLTSTREGAFLWRKYGTSVEAIFDISPGSPGLQRFIHLIKKLERRVVRPDKDLPTNDPHPSRGTAPTNHQEITDRNPGLPTETPARRGMKSLFAWFPITWLTRLRTTSSDSSGELAGMEDPVVTKWADEIYADMKDDEQLPH